jgi:hypothetical protein
LSNPPNGLRDQVEVSDGDLLRHPLVEPLANEPLQQPQDLGIVPTDRFVRGGRDSERDPHVLDELRRQRELALEFPSGNTEHGDGAPEEPVHECQGEPPSSTAHPTSPSEIPDDSSWRAKRTRGTMDSLNVPCLGSGARRPESASRRTTSGAVPAREASSSIDRAISPNMVRAVH